MSAATSKSQRSVREEIDRVIVLLKRSLTFWKRALVVFLVTTAVAVPLALTTRRVYRSETVILYQDAIRSNEIGVGQDSVETTRRVGARLRELLMSRASLEPIVKEMHLYIKSTGEPDQRDLIDAVDEMRTHIQFRSREGDTFEISFDGESPEIARDGAKRLADCIVQEAANRRSEHAKTLKEFLDAESDRNKVEVRTKEAALAQFLALHPEYVALPPGMVPTAQTGRPARPGADGDQSIAALEWKAARIERQLKAQPGAAPPPRPPPPAATRLPDSAELIAARKDFEEKSAHFTEKHPDVTAARIRLRAAEAAQAAAQAAADAKAAATAPDVPEPKAPENETDRDALKKDLAELKALIAAKKKAAAKAAGTAQAPTPAVDATGGSVTLEVEFRRLQSELADARDRQRQLDDKQFKASISASSAMNDRNIQVSVLDPAFLPTHPISRPRRMLVMAGLLIALVLALLTALISARLDDRIHDKLDIEILDLMPILGVIPSPKALPKKSG
jgi:capsular polysaccharide biosynthesis protein